MCYREEGLDVLQRGGARCVTWKVIKSKERGMLGSLL